MAQSNFAQTESSPMVKRLVQKLSGSYVDNSLYDAFGLKSEVYATFLDLCAVATVPELRQLTDHSSPVIRCYAFMALARIDSVDLMPLIAAHLNDTASLQTKSYCLVTEESVADVAIGLVSFYISDEYGKSRFESRYDDLDRLLVCTPNRLAATSRRLESISPDTSLYECIRDRFFRDSLPGALVALAKFQRPKDVPLILNALQAENENSHTRTSACLAAESFPHPEFLKPLLHLLSSSLNSRFNYPEWQSLYNALVMYRGDTFCMQSLVAELNKSDEPHSARLPILYSSAHRYRDSGMSELLWKMWESFGYIAAEDFKTFIRIDSTRAYQLTRRSLDSLGHTLNAARKVIEQLQFNGLAGYSQYLSGEIEVELVFAMLSYVGERDSVYTRQILTTVLAGDDLYEAQSIMRYLKQRPDRSLVDAMFRRLFKEDNTYVYMPLAEALVVFDDQTIVRRLKQARAANEALRTNWGGEQYSRLLQSLDQ